MTDPALESLHDAQLKYDLWRRKKHKVASVNYVPADHDAHRLVTRESNFEQAPFRRLQRKEYY